MPEANLDVTFIYQIPHHEWKMLCLILDERDCWEELGGEYMGLDMLTLNTLRRETEVRRSPTESLLLLWSQQNHTVLELFVHLSRMQHYQAMLVLKPFVDEEYHQLIYEGEENLGGQSAAAIDVDDQPSDVSPGSHVPPELDHQGPADSSMVSSASSSTSEVLVKPSTSKSLCIDSCNINRSEECTDMPNKVVLPAECGESKILNTQPQPKETPESQPRDGSASVTAQVCVGNDLSSLMENCNSVPLVDPGELQQATSGWSDEDILGKGSFGIVYKGIWNCVVVAIKRLQPRARTVDSREQDCLLLRELTFPNSCPHDNVLPIRGVCLGGASPCLVYQFMPNGSVKDRLQCKNRTPPLGWVQRLKIAEGTALALQFLHTCPTPVVHGNIKSANILLGTDFEPRLADFGLAREENHSDYSRLMAGRIRKRNPYLPQEFKASPQLSVKVDTYSYGVVLFELATGLPAYQEDRHNKYLKDHVLSSDEIQLSGLVDKRVPDDCGVFLGLVHLGEQCVAHRPQERPSMMGVPQAVRNLAAATEPARAQHQLMQQSLALSRLAAYHESITRQKRASSAQSTIQPPQCVREKSPESAGCPKRDCVLTPPQSSVPLPEKQDLEGASARCSGLQPAMETCSLGDCTPVEEKTLDF